MLVLRARGGCGEPRPRTVRPAVPQVGGHSHPQRALPLGRRCRPSLERAQHPTTRSLPVIIAAERGCLDGQERQHLERPALEPTVHQGELRRAHAVEQGVCDADDLRHHRRRVEPSVLRHEVLRLLPVAAQVRERDQMRDRRCELWHQIADAVERVLRRVEPLAVEGAEVRVELAQHEPHERLVGGDACRGAELCQRRIAVAALEQLSVAVQHQAVGERESGLVLHGALERGMLTSARRKRARENAVSSAITRSYASWASA